MPWFMLAVMWRCVGRGARGFSATCLCACASHVLRAVLRKKDARSLPLSGSGPADGLCKLLFVAVHPRGQHVRALS